MSDAIIDPDPDVIKNSLAKKMGARTEYMHRLQTLQDADRLLLAGHYPNINNENAKRAGGNGRLTTTEFDSVATQILAEAGPGIAAGAYAKVTVKPFKHVFPRV